MPPSSLQLGGGWGGGGGGGRRNFRKVFAGWGGGGGSEIFILVVGGYVVGGRGNFVGRRGHVILKQKLKLHKTSIKSIFGITKLIYFRDI